MAYELCYRKVAYTLLLIFTGMASLHAQPSLKGAWELTAPDASIKKVAIATDNYLVQATYDTAMNEFIESLGGPYQYKDGSLNITLDFHSSNSRLVGKNQILPLQIHGDSLTLVNAYGGKEIWHRTDKGKGPLAGSWRITQRQQNSEMHTLPAGDRKTLKNLSGKRFQWTAFNSATGAFAGCGGGTYTFKNGLYTEHVQYFSRDNSRVGMSLNFRDEVKDSLWRHKGKSTKGAPVYEIWKLQ